VDNQAVDVLSAVVGGLNHDLERTEKVDEFDKILNSNGQL
jgi:hypothetical protein